MYLAIVEDREHRGLVVQQGGAKAMLPLANEGTEVGKTKAAQALAKIAITMNPEVAFPGQRVGILFTGLAFFCICASQTLYFFLWMRKFQL